MPGPYIHISSMRHAAALMAANGYTPAQSKRINPCVGRC